MLMPDKPEEWAGQLDDLELTIEWTATAHDALYDGSCEGWRVSDWEVERYLTLY